MVMGRFDYAIQDLDKAEEIWRTDGNLYGLSVSNLIKGWIYFEIGEFELGRVYIKKYIDFNFEHHPQLLQRNKVDSSILIGLIDAREGKLDSASMKLAEARELMPGSRKEDPKWATIQEFSCNLLRAEILLAEGAFGEVIEVMENAAPLEVPAMSPPAIMRLNMPLYQDLLARAYMKKGEWDKAIAEYENLINFNPDSTDRRVVPLLYHYRIAKLYEQKGWKGKAIEHYEIFLAPWEDAESSPSDIEDARKRLAGLK
jgi:tetratricopeptide (TPR) repeat protein